MTDWWYSYEPCEKFMRTAGRIVQVSLRNLHRGRSARKRMSLRTDVDTGSTELGKHLDRVGLGTYLCGKAEEAGVSSKFVWTLCRLRLTDGRNDRGLEWRFRGSACILQARRSVHERDRCRRVHDLVRSL